MKRPGSGNASRAVRKTSPDSGQSRRIPCTCPVEGSCRIATGRDPSPSIVTAPLGLESVIRSSSLAHSGCTGRANAKAAPPSPSALAAISKLKANNSLPSASSPVSRYGPLACGSTGGGVDHKRRLEDEFAARPHSSPQQHRRRRGRRLGCCAGRSVFEGLAKIVVADPPGPAVAHQVRGVGMY